MQTIFAEIITIGDELLIGQVVNTNASWMAQVLNHAGITVLQVTTVRDDRKAIMDAVAVAMSRVDIVLTTGGLGPTKDDITKTVLCDYFQTRLVEDMSVRAHVHALYKNRPEVLNSLTATQWLVPSHATVLPNRVGSAPIMVFNQDKRVLVSMPGVPHEMQIAMTEQVMPYLQEHCALAADIIHRTIVVYGIPESTLALRIEQWEKNLPKSIHLAYLPKQGVVRLRLSSYSEATEQEVEQQISTLLPLIDDHVIATDDLTPQAVLGQWLTQRKQTIATAESCTGGRLAALLNEQSGSSAYYMGSVIAYANSVKRQVLGVSPDTLATDGAVSEACVRQMAEGVRALLHTDYAVATSGIAGPTGGTTDKPVGTVWLAWATPEGTFAECRHFSGDRAQITDNAAMAAVGKLLLLIKKT
ncbi:MAG: CinA family nicotinamide mononucleotide deamidase-related protein [Paludibacteraceae bacterium]|nr:CinA family nicotinamide mononucleotide deamidase-related protein [Paludibacteraceae bacterium]